jgi:hypothetical protein
LTFDYYEKQGDSNVMDVAVRFERWQRRLEFSLAIFKLKRFDCARSSA